MRGLLHQFGMGDRGGAHHHPTDTRPGELFDVGDGAHSPTGLHPGRTSHRFADRSNERTVDRVTGAGSIEVDHMDPGGAGLGEGTGDGNRIVAVDRLVGIVTLAQAHAASASNVDRGIHDHDGTPNRTTLCSSARPAAADFSGWNWVAITLPRSTIEATCTP